MKRFITIAVIVIFAIFIILLVSPFLFKGKLMQLAKTELNKSVHAQVDFKDLKLSFIRNFPNAYVALDGLSVVGVGDFAGETLVAFDRFAVTVDIKSVFKMDNIQIKSVLLDHPVINAHILADKRVNWDILRVSDTEAIPDPAKETAPKAFNVTLKRFEIKDAQLSYQDDSAKMKLAIGNLNYLLQGDMAKEKVDLKMNLAIKDFDYWQNGIRMANKAEVGFSSEIDADMKNLDFVLKDNQFNINHIVLKFAGSVGLKGNDTNLDIVFETEKTDFKSLLSLVPAVYMKDFHTVQTAGNLTLKGEVKGTINEAKKPIVDLQLGVTDAMFKYPSLPKQVDKIAISLNVHYDGEVFDHTTIDLNTLKFEMASNPFSSEVHVRTPESDLHAIAKLNGKIDLDSLTEIVPLGDTKIKGLLETNLSIDGRLSTLEAKRYDDFTAAGMIRLGGFDYESPDFPQGVKITRTQLDFTPRRVELSNFIASTGSSDISMNGTLDNFIAYAFRGDTLKGNLTLRSNKINLNEFMGDKTEQKEETPETPETKSNMSVIEVPENVDFNMNINIGKVLFDDLDIDNITGNLNIKEGAVHMQNVAMRLLEGSLTLNGEYNTVDIANPFINFAVSARQLDIPTTLETFDMLSTFIAEPRNYTGKVTANITLHAILDEFMSPVMETLASKGTLQTQNIQIHNSELFATLASVTKNERWRTPAPGNMEIHYEIREGRLWLVRPIVMNIPPAKVEIIGDQGLDMTLNYRVDASMPISSLGSGATDVLDRIPGGSGVTEVKLIGGIAGTVKKPEVSISVGDMTSSITEAVKEKVEEVIVGKMDEARQELESEINRQIVKIMQEAETQANNVRNTAKVAADRVRSEANSNADKLISGAANKGILERNAAKLAADKLRNEGEANAKKIEQEGEQQAQNIMDAAKKQCDELRK